MVTKRVGVIGGGQLAWMLAQEAPQLGLELVVQTPQREDPAVALAQGVVLGPVDSAIATAALAQTCDVITFENEFVDLESLGRLEEQGVIFYPSLGSLAPLLDKLDQRRYLQSLGLPVPQFSAYEGQDSIPRSFPFVLKARRHGYDGQGTWVVPNQDDFDRLQPGLNQGDWLLEDFIPFERELAVVAARNNRGEMALYPVVETHQVNQVCRWVVAPADVPQAVQVMIEDYTRRILEALNFVGILGIEFFLSGDRHVLINELAPRTHNSGHYSLDACQTSQFAMQLQAVAGLPLGSPALTSSQAVMVNLLGYEDAQDDYAEKRQALANLENAQLHWYGKNESRVGRKLGHLTILVEEIPYSRQQIEALVRQVEALWYPASLGISKGIG